MSTGSFETLVFDVGTRVKVQDLDGITLTAGSEPCTQESPTLIQCFKATVDFFHVNGTGSTDLVSTFGTTEDGEFIMGAGFDNVIVGPGQDSVRGGSGNDTVSYETHPAAVTVSPDGVADDGMAGEGDRIYGDVEVVIGSNHDDTLMGGPNGNRLEGGPGDDALVGGAGSDVIFGDDGDDSLRGLAGSDHLEGGLDDDTLYGFVGGPDILDGNEGFDAVIYDVPASVDLDIRINDAIANDGPAGQHDWVLSTNEVIVGGDGNDVLVGNAEDNWLIGGGGFDQLAGNGGADVVYAEGTFSELDGGDGDDLLLAYQGTDKDIIGGPGTDTVSYAGYVSWDLSVEDYATSAVIVDLDGKADDGYAGQKDEVEKDVENIEGTHFAGDKLSGSSQANVLRGFGGNDTLSGGGGSDVLEPQEVIDAGADSDVVRGGGGVDLVSYAGTTDSVFVWLNNKADDGPAGDLDNVRTDVEGIEGGAGNDEFIANGGTDTLLGGPGSDDLNGAGGNDLLDGGPDSDIGDAGGGTKDRCLSMESNLNCELFV
ncbi:calcium-binding protein [Nocardioides humilatus]|nr:calcium-binding protein [Nocardioides humilatus]